MTTDNADSRALRTLGLLTRGALHELSNPLLALSGSVELALADAEPGTKLHERLALARRTSAEITEIVRALQGFVRAHAEPERELSVGEAAADAAALVELVLPLQGREVRVEGDARTVARPGPLRGELVALLVAALDAAEPGTLVELTVRDDAVRATGGGELRL